MKKYPYIVFVLLLALTIKSCKTEICKNNLPEPINEINDKISKKSTFGQEAIIRWDELNEHTPKEKWEQFFIQRGAEEFWQPLNNDYSTLIFDSRALTDPQIETTQQLEEVTKGMVHYLVCYQVPISSLTLIYGRKAKLTNNIVSDIVSDLVKLTELKILRLSYYQFGQLPPQLSELTSLQELNLSYNQLTTLPNELGKLSKLTTLNLSFNKFTAISFDISSFVKLRTIDLTHNKLKQVPLQLTDLTNLCKLNLSNNQLTELPQELSKLTRLNDLDLSSNQLKAISFNISDLVNLNTFTICYNQLTQLPDEIGKLSRLERLNLRHNQIEQLPDQLDELTNLRMLNLSHNKLNKLLPQIVKLSKIQFLDLSHNQLISIISGIEKLTTLHSIDLSHNQLKLLPSKLCNLVNLARLNISFNQLIKLPASIMPKLLNLKAGLTLNNNPWLTNTKYSKITRESLLAPAYQQFPYSLRILCMQLIKNHPQLFNQEKIDMQLPKELHYTKRVNQLRQAYTWKAGENIVYFRMIQMNAVPFYLDYPLTCPKAVESTLAELNHEPLYKISEI